MSTLSAELIEALNAAAWVGKTLSVALAYSPSDPWDETYGYGDVVAFLIADGTLGIAWQTIEPETGDFTTTAAGASSSDYLLTFTRDTSGTVLNVTHAVVLEPISGPSWRLVSWQQLAAEGSVVAVPAGQIVQVNVRLGHGR
jgi:hypothetical protein